MDSRGQVGDKARLMSNHGSVNTLCLPLLLLLACATLWQHVVICVSFISCYTWFKHCCFVAMYTGSYSVVFPFLGLILSTADNNKIKLLFIFASWWLLTFCLILTAHRTLAFASRSPYSGRTYLTDRRRSQSEARCNVFQPISGRSPEVHFHLWSCEHFLVEVKATKRVPLMRAVGR